jgi:putative mRNA 3-end processing factor
MQIKFLGGAQEVGRSAILLKDDRSLLLDFGIKIDHKTQYPLSIPKVDGLLLSHAHLDHSGFAAALYNDLRIPTFGTLPTLKLSTLLIEDALNIAKRQRSRVYFHKKQIRELTSKYISMDYKAVNHFGNFDIELYDAGHICGSSITLIERARAHNNKRIVYTGDFKLKEQTLHKGADVVKSDVLIMESTYASHDHSDRSKTIDNLVNGIKEVLQDGGNALLPVFAVGRAQEILSILGQNNLTGSAFIDGMAKKATSIVIDSQKFIRNPEVLAKAIRETTFIEDRSARKDALDGPSIIVTTAGMLNGGPVLDYITKLNKGSHIFLTGYQIEGTNGRTLMDSGYISIDGTKRKISTPVSFYDLSAHSDKSDLHEYVRRSDPDHVICVHGDTENAKRLASDLADEGFDAKAPKIGETIKIDD